MKVITGRVVGGKIELSSPLKDGTAVAVLAALLQIFDGVEQGEL